MRSMRYVVASEYYDIGILGAKQLGSSARPCGRSRAVAVGITYVSDSYPRRITGKVLYLNVHAGDFDLLRLHLVGVNRCGRGEYQSAQDGAAKELPSRELFLFTDRTLHLQSLFRFVLQILPFVVTF